MPHCIKGEEHEVTGAKVLRYLRKEIAELGFGVAPEDHACTAVTGKQVGEVLCQPVEDHVTDSRGTTVMKAEKRTKFEVLWVKSYRIPYTCMVATMLASWTCLPAMLTCPNTARSFSVTAGPSSAT